MNNEIPISEIFGITLQGEGVHLGEPTIFVRVFGCNVGKTGRGFCPWCDTRYAIEKIDDTSKIVPIEYVVNKVIELSKDRCFDVTFSGGEPLLYEEQILEVMKLLVLSNDKYKFHFETNGLIRPGEEMLKYNVDFTVSPKFHAIDMSCKELHQVGEYVGTLRGLIQLTSADHPMSFKFVYEGPQTIDDIKKLEWLCMGFGDIPVFIMPEGKDFDREKYIEAAAACTENGWRLSPRLHTILWGVKRGV